MRSLIPAAMALSAMLVAVPAAHAEVVTPPADFTAFSVAVTYESFDSDMEPVPLVLLSDTAGKTVFSIPGLDVLDAVSGGSSGVNDQYWLTLGIVPRPGYVITGYELSGTVAGHFDIGTPPPGAVNISYGYGESDAYFGINSPYPGNVQIADLQGVQTFEFTTPGSGVWPGYPYAEVGIWGFIHSNAISTYYDYYGDPSMPTKSPSSVHLSVSDSRFTVHWEVVPVPEPSTWAMLAIGLLSLGALGNRPASRTNQQ